MHEEKSRGSGLESRKTRLEVTGRGTREVAASGKRVGTLAPVTARCKIRLVGLLRDGSRRSWVVPNVPSPRQARDSERKFGKNVKNPVKEKRMKRWLCTVDRPSDRDYFFTGEGEGCEENPVKEKRMKRWLCTVDRPSDRDYFFTGEGEGCEENLNLWLGELGAAGLGF
ncbi:hypothetical protein CDL15_Pgr013183 [Punica granatum]|uniref:Uncharacterized protein n=1 Tax=Punica granatum TaxID=22663 RepID=A0A218W9E2_PUNGR|nr:hypothetical protein CDL15_Pgr013183 [Punica granatum]